MVPDSSSTSHSIVGLPRLSRISRPTMSTMALIQFLSISCGMRRIALDAFDDDHAHDGRALARRSRGAVLDGVVERLRLLDARELQHDQAVRLPVALEHLERAAAHADLGAVRL